MEAGHRWGSLQVYRMVSYQLRSLHLTGPLGSIYPWSGALCVCVCWGGDYPHSRSTGRGTSPLTPRASDDARSLGSLPTPWVESLDLLLLRWISGHMVTLAFLVNIVLSTAGQKLGSTRYFQFSRPVFFLTSVWWFCLWADKNSMNRFQINS